jgi:SWI/SNF-related matrix-associated actin-dependent regulator of chromatin subfamily D
MSLHTPHRHTRNKTSLGSITYADLANTLKRPAPGLPPMLQQQQPATIAQQRQQHAHDNRQETFRRNATVPTDREVPDGAKNMVIGDVVQRYEALRDIERKLDAVMINKRLAARDSGQRYERRVRTVRIWITSKSIDKEPGDTHMNDAFDFGDDAVGGSYKLRIEGRLLPDADGEDDEVDPNEVDPDEDDSDEDDSDSDDPDKDVTMDLDKPDESPTETKSAPKNSDESPKFSHFFKQITIEFQLPRHALPNAVVPPAIEWKRPEPASNNTRSLNPEANFDALEFERRMEESSQKVIVTLHRAEPNGRVRGKLSEPLARLLDREYEDQSGAMMGLYNYVRTKGLEEEGHPQRFRCDDALRAVGHLQDFCVIILT